MKVFYQFFFLSIIIFSCSLDKPKHAQNLVKDFNLGWWSDPRYQALYINKDHEEYGGSMVVPETIVAVGFNEDFIIAMQHPNKLKEIETRVLNNEVDGGYRIDDPADTAFLPKEYLVKREGEWILKTEGVSHLDYLFPYKNDTLFYILDIRDFKYLFWKNDNIYSYSSYREFLLKREALGVPDSLKFHDVYDEELIRDLSGEH